jgi:uncharacterized protein YeaO (DUF488 family)
MALRIVRLGTTRLQNEGLRVGTVRRPPRGVRKSEYAKRNYFDIWLPELSPSPAWVRTVLSRPLNEREWARYVRRYRSEMRTPEKQHLLALLAQLSRHANFSVGCYCESENRCHRSILSELLREHGAIIASKKHS